MAEPGPDGIPPRVPFRRRSRAIAWAKVLLPLAALALLSTMFLLAREPVGPGDVPFAQLEEIAREPRIDRPRLSGVAPDGTTVTLSADRLTPLPGREDVYAVTKPRLDTRSPTGGTASLTAGAGEVDGPTRRLRLAGGVQVEASPATAVQTSEVTADLSTGTAITGPVTGTTPFGEIEAGWLALEAGGEDGAARLLFDGGVRLLYHPQVPRPEVP